MKMIVLRKVVITFIICFSLMPAQLEKVEFKPEPTKMVEFGDLGAARHGGIGLNLRLEFGGWTLIKILLIEISEG